MEYPGPVLVTRPEAIAVVGASMRNFYTRWSIENLLRYGFPGRILPVTLKQEPVLGLESYTAVESLPCDVQLGVIGVRSDRCLPMAKRLAERGCRTLVVLSDGFREIGTAEGRELEQELAEWCLASGVVLLGPNGVGFADFASALVCIGEPIPTDVTSGPVSIVSQSGGMLATALAGLTTEGVGIDFAVSIGNGAGLDLISALDMCLQRPGTEVIAAYVEGFGSDVPRMMSTLQQIETSGKQLFVVKPGRSANARQLVMSHTATLAGPDTVVRSLLSEHGVGILDTMEQLVRTCRIALKVPRFSGRDGVAVLGSSGGAASVTSDMAADYRVPLSSYTESTEHALHELVPGSGHVGNPIDLSGRSGGGQVDTQRIYDLIAADPTAAVLLVPFSAILPDDSPQRASHRDYLEQLANISDRQAKPLIISTVAGQPGNGWLREFESRHSGTMVLNGLDATMAALGALSTDVVGSHIAGGDRLRIGEPSQGHPRAMHEAAGRAILAAIGFPIVPGQRCDNDSELGAAADAVGFPLVAKGVLPNVAHKAAIGGVAVGLSSVEAVTDAVSAMRSTCRDAGIVMDGVLLERMVSGIELLVGLTRDPLYGPAITLGLGGVFAETTDLHATATLPFRDRCAISRLVHAAGISQVIERAGIAGEHFMSHVLRLSTSFVSGDLSVYETVEINPVFLTPDGEVFAADVLILSPPSLA